MASGFPHVLEHVVAGKQLQFCKFSINLCIFAQAIPAFVSVEFLENHRAVSTLR